ncbi:unnamed protein product [Cylicostephanus goldi]|uniref:Uncharacterized protein n=1 Tax=Cylicostephanus goldi TaxID=71465 RepID=A0A3P6QU94_CYLGO|nr:unnamed protein product [Cylicostephanus goldi]
MSQDKVKSGEKVSLSTESREKVPKAGIAKEEKKKQITKIRDSEAGGLPSVKNEDFFHGFVPREQVGLDVSTKKYNRACSCLFP